MHKSASFHFRAVLVGSLALIAAASASVTHAAPADQASTPPDQSVTIDAFAFAPAETSLTIGSTLVWTNAQSGVRHTASSVDGLWDSGVLSTADSFGFTFNQVGDFAYQCNIHPSMRGVVHVLADPGSTPTATPAPTAIPTTTPSSYYAY